MTTDAKTLLKYANLQMAAEAFLTDKVAAVEAKTTGSISHHGSIMGSGLSL